MRPQHNYKSQTAFDSKRIRKRTLKSIHIQPRKQIGKETNTTFFINNQTGLEITTAGKI